MRRHRLVLLLLLAGSLAGALIIEVLDRTFHGALAAYHRDPAGGGGIAWRGGAGQRFLLMLRWVGLPVYPLAALGAALALRQALRGREGRVAALLLFAVFAAVLLRFVSLGVASAALGA